VKAYLLIAIGSGLGGVARHWLSGVIATRVASVFPWGTFIVNVLGSALIGFVLGASDVRISPATRQFLTVGILGGFTTFSAFSAQTMQLFQHGKAGVALAYALASVVLCVCGCCIGWAIGDKM
jgi:fluoride exporter